MLFQEAFAIRILRLDGLRALAVIAVMLHHHTYLDGGWIGVELFFVLSGLLITRILRRDRTSRVYWKRFYIRRATRILPPVLLLIGVVAHQYHPPVSSVLLYIFFLGNFVSFTPHGIFELGLIWSLAVEEHFYLVFPFAIRYLERDTLIKVLLAVIAAEPVLRYVATNHVVDYIRIYFWTCFHLDGLAMGALLALLLEDERVVTWFTRWAGLAALGTGAIFGTLSFLFPVRFERTANAHLFNLLGYSLLSLASLFIVAYVLLRPETLANRLLELRPLIFIGTISYGLYLYHVHIMFVLMKLTGKDYAHVFPLSAAVAILVSWLSFRFYEKPFINWGHRVSSRLSA